MLKRPGRYTTFCILLLFISLQSLCIHPHLQGFIHHRDGFILDTGVHTSPKTLSSSGLASPRFLGYVLSFIPESRRILVLRLSSRPGQFLTVDKEQAPDSLRLQRLSLAVPRVASAHATVRVSQPHSNPSSPTKTTQGNSPALGCPATVVGGAEGG